MQARLQPYGVGSTVSVQTMVGAEVGTDDVTFAVGRTNQVWLDGAAYTFGSSGVMTLAGGTVTETSSGTYRVNWNTGETMSVTVNGAYINDTIQLTGADAGNVQGLLGPDTGSAANDLQLANGTPLGTTITSSELYGAFASAWRITQPASLLNYAIGQTTTTFTDTSFPADVLQLDQLPASVVAEAEQLAEQAGITDPNLIQAAAIDLLVTGNPSAVFASANVQQQGMSLFGAGISNPPPLPEVGISANTATAVETTTGTLAVGYTVYLTAAEAQATTIQYKSLPPRRTIWGWRASSAAPAPVPCRSPPARPARRSSLTCLPTRLAPSPCPTCRSRSRRPAARASSAPRRKPRSSIRPQPPAIPRSRCWSNSTATATLLAAAPATA